MAGPTQQELIDLKADVTHVAEVATGKVGGLVGGADIASSTNRLGGVRKTLPEAIAELEASSVRGDLADQTDPDNGAGMVGVAPITTTPSAVTVLTGTLRAVLSSVLNRMRLMVDSQHINAFDYFTPAEIADVTSRGLTLDVTAACRTALAAAKAANRPIRFPAGYYMVDGTDTGVFFDIAKHGLYITGDGDTQTLFLAKGGTSGFRFFYPVDDTTQWESVRISNLGVSRIGAIASGNDYGFCFRNMAHTKVFKARADNLGGGAGMAVWFSKGSVDCQAEDMVFQVNNGEDINFYGSDGSVHKCSSSRTRHINTMAPAIEIEGRSGSNLADFRCYDISVTDAEIYSTADLPYASAGAEGLLAIGATRLKVNGLRVNRRGQHGVKITGCKDSVFSGVIVDDIGATGMHGVFVTRDVFGDAGVSDSLQFNGLELSNNNGCGFTTHYGESGAKSTRISVSNITTRGNNYGIVGNNVSGLSIKQHFSDGNTTANQRVTNCDGVVDVDGCGNDDTLLSVPFVQSASEHTMSADGVLTLDCGSGQTRHTVYLNANVTGINFTGVFKLGQRVSVIFHQTAGSKTVTTTNSAWLVNGSAFCQFDALTVPSLPGSSIAGRWGWVEFEVTKTPADLPGSLRFVQVGSVVNIG